MCVRVSRKTSARVKRQRRIAVWSAVTILVGALVLPLFGYLYAGVQQAQAAAATEETNPRSNYWRAVREGNVGYTAVQGQETNVLIQNGGQNWRQARNGPLATYGGWALFIALVGITAFFAWRGRIVLEKGRSGRKVKRWSLAERTLHWFTASLFIVLAITGLSMFFGRALLIPLLGPQGFASWAQLGLTLHNYLGPAFSVGVLLIIVSWIRHNIPSKEDLAWFKQGGGIFSEKHPSAGRMNAGEKVWFWLIATVGVGVVITGFILDFPNFGQSRETMQLSNLLHGILAMVWIVVFLGHMYIGTVGTEGALEGMTTGYVDENWAKQHHDIWYDELQRKGGAEAPAAKPSGAMKEQPT